MSFHVQRHGSRMRVELDADGCTVTVLDGDPVPIHARPGETGPLLDPHLRPTDDVGDGSGPDRVDGIVMVPPGGRLRVPEGGLPPILTRAGPRSRTWYPGPPKSAGVARKADLVTLVLDAGCPAGSVGRLDGFGRCDDQVGWLWKRVGEWAWCQVVPVRPPNDVSHRPFRRPRQA